VGEIDKIVGIVSSFALLIMCSALMAVATDVVIWVLATNVDRLALFGWTFVGTSIVVGIIVMNKTFSVGRQQAQAPAQIIITPQVQNTPAPTVQTVQTPSDDQYHIGGIPDLERERR
jgi:hypothetical protein